VNEIDPEAGIETDPRLEKVTVLAPVTTDETTMLLPVPVDVSWMGPPLRATGPERVTTAELALVKRLSWLAVVLAERVSVVAELPVSCTDAEDESVPPTTIEGALEPTMTIFAPPLEESAPDTAMLCAPPTLMMMSEVPEVERVPVIVRSEVSVPPICNRPDPLLGPPMRLPAIVPPTVVMVRTPPDEMTPPAWKFVSAFVKPRVRLLGLEMVAFEPMVSVAMLVKVTVLVTESVPKTLSVVGWPLTAESRRDDDTGMLRELPGPSPMLPNVAETPELIDNEPPPLLKVMPVLVAVPAAAVIVATGLPCEKMMEVVAP